MSSCIADNVKQFCNSFVSLRMDLSNNNGPTVEYTTLAGTSGEDAKAWIANNIGLDISGWKIVYNRSEKNSSGAFNTVRLLDDHWIFVNREYAGLSFQQTPIKNGSFFIEVNEYFNLSGVSVGNDSARSPATFTMKRDMLLNVYNSLNNGTHYINESGFVVQKPRDMTAKQFIAEHNPSVPDPNVEFGEYLYGINSISSAISGQVALAGLKTRNLSSIFTQNGLFADTGTIWSLMQLHAAWNNQIPVANSIWGIGAVGSGNVGFNGEIPKNAISYYSENDGLAGKGRSVLQVNKKPGRYKRPKDGMDGKDADLIKDTKKQYWSGSIIRRGDEGWGATGNTSALNAMYGQDFDPDHFATAMLLKTNLFQAAISVTSAIENSSEEIFQQQWEYLFPEIKKLGNDWQRFILSSPTNLDMDSDDQDNLVIETLSNIGIGGDGMFNKLYPNGYTDVNNNIEKAIGYWSEYNRFFGSWSVNDEYGHSKRLIPHGTYDADIDGNSVNGIQAFNIFGSQRYNLGTKSWGVKDNAGSLSFINGDTLFENSPFWRFQSGTSSASDLADEMESAGAGSSVHSALGRGALKSTITSGYTVTGEAETIHLLLVDAGSTPVPSFEDILSKYEKNTYLKINSFNQNEYHATVGMDFYGAGAYNQNIWNDCKEVWEKFRDWAYYQEDRDNSLGVYLYGEKEEDVTKVKDRELTAPDSSIEDQKNSINPSVKNFRSLSSSNIYECSHDLNMDFIEYELGYEFTSDAGGAAVKLIEAEGNWEKRQLMTYLGKCPPSSISRTGFTLINELYTIDQDLLKSLDSINFTVKGGTLHAEYSFGDSQIIPNYESLVAAKYALNRVIR